MEKTKTKARWGSGGVFQRPGSSLYWYRVSYQGKQYRGSTGFADYRKAVSLLDAYRGKLRGGSSTPSGRDVSVGESGDRLPSRPRIR